LPTGALLIGVSVLFANFVSFNGLLVLWVLTDIGQTLADLPSETLIGESIDNKDQEMFTVLTLHLRICGGLFLIR
jgi:NRE family putative nickel resistance protein-like MFS transporter